jgi:hypothetical protein
VYSFCCQPESRTTRVNGSRTKQHVCPLRMENLTLNQRRALAQLQDLTNGGDDDVAVSVLGSVQWDVQV